MARNQFRALGIIGALVAVVLIAVPALGVDPSRSPSTGSAPTDPLASADPSTAASPDPSAGSPAPAAPAEDREPATSEDPDEDEAKPEKAAKPEKGPKVPDHPVTLTGVVGQASGDGEFTLTVGSTVYELSAGPKWWWGEDSPLAAVVGKTATIDGEQKEGSTEVDVLAIDGTAVREPGKPPWAGGWRVVGPRHPGWAQWKVDKQAAREQKHAGGTNGKDTAPGQLKKDDATP